MTLLFRDDYKIKVNTYSYDLYKKVIAEKDTKTHKKGDEYWRDEGYFTKLSSVFNKIILLNGSKSNETIDARDFLILWGSIVEKFEENVEIIKEEI
jgi:hypothetical protein